MARAPLCEPAFVRSCLRLCCVHACVGSRYCVRVCVCVCLFVFVCICADASKVILQKAISNFHDPRACSTGVVQTGPVGKADNEGKNTRKKKKEKRKEKKGVGGGWERTRKREVWTEL